MAFIAAAKTSELPIGTMQPVVAGGQKLLLAHVQEGFFAIAATCPHMGADLCKGTLTGAIVICPKHRAAFNVTNGETVDPAKILFLKMRPKNAASFAVKVENDQVLIDV